MVAAQESPAPEQPLADCAAIDDDAARLACYDRLAGRPAAAGTAPIVAPYSPGGRTPNVIAPAPGQERAPTPSFLSRFWELEPADKRGVFNFNGYRPNYFLPVHVTSDINTDPSSPTQARDLAPEPFQRVEAKFQISLRSKLFENLLLPGADLWGAYTQQSVWQLYNTENSAPFRNTDYQPELIYMMPVPQRLGALPLGWHWRFGQLGLAHQSNGQQDPLSRSWNRAYVGFGLENEHVSIVARFNHRFSESPETDDNPDLTDYIGRNELQVGWAPGRATALATYKYSFGLPRRGSLTLDWSYPIKTDSMRALRWYAQFFTGYGENLLDYNFRQTSLGVGVALIEF
ncbi:phospholipase A1 [Rivibacter subsaxonicus]|uniref:Phospholipase A1 n=2 Tax=Rivibacter subsaxonicus TaxID=457575 RepID=A0A4Q7VWY5_9BURK|nr:phospholipase A1 [Rivibacter subsaxonicus]